MNDPLHCLGVLFEQSTHPDIDDVTRNLAYEHASELRVARTCTAIEEKTVYQVIHLRSNEASSSSLTCVDYLPITSQYHTVYRYERIPRVTLPYY